VRVTPEEGLSRREGQIMEIVHREGRATVARIRAQLPDPPSASTVRKLLEILRGKGELERAYDGPRHVYFPAVSPRRARRSVLRRLLRTFFGGSREAAIAALMRLDGETLTEEDLRRIAEAARRGEDEPAERENHR